MIKRNGFIVLISFFLAISMLANVYSFKNKDTKNSEYSKRIEFLEKEVKERDSKIKIVEKEKLRNQTTDEYSPLNEKEHTRSKDEMKINSINKFIEYAFNTHEDDYVTRKKLAKNYMVNELFETIFSADGITEEQLKMKVEVEEIEVYLSTEDEGKAIVRYMLHESKAQDEYDQTYLKYLQVNVIEDNGSFKVEEINSLTIDDWGI